MHVHVATNIKDLLVWYQQKTLEHSPYSPDMSPCDFNHLPNMKFTKGSCFTREKTSSM